MTSTEGGGGISQCGFVNQSLFFRMTKVGFHVFACDTALKFGNVAYSNMRSSKLTPFLWIFHFFTKNIGQFEI